MLELPVGLCEALWGFVRLCQVMVGMVGPWGGERGPGVGREGPWGEGGRRERGCAERGPREK